MNRISKELIKIAREIKALDEDNERLEQAAAKDKKYILHHQEGNLWRIQYCKDVGDAKKGDFGGLIESEKNLSHKGRCCIYDDAKVYENARVIKDGSVGDEAQVYGNAIIKGGYVSGTAEVCDNAKVIGGSISGDVKVLDNVYIKYAQDINGSPIICGHAFINTGG